MTRRPCFLVVDREHAASLSTRKLVIETAKFNVITAYSAEEALETLRRFPAVDGAVLDIHIDGAPCDVLIGQLKAIQPNLPVVVITSPLYRQCVAADYLLESFSAKPLLELLQKLRPQETQEITANEEKLHAED